MSTLDTGEIPMLKGRADSGADIEKNFREERGPFDARTVRQRPEQTVRCGDPRLHRISEGGDHIDDVPSVRGAVEHCVLDPHPGWVRVPHRDVVQPGAVVDDQPRP
ncbi:hypothetical protein [Gordonia malaquae]|uniref:hypothetical protein n=1 Tax=Gordonia malaquae TaxID=410332 RepID=UPI0030FF29D0